MMTMMPRTRYSIKPILKAAILEKIQREGLTKAPNDDPIDWYKRTYCLQPRLKPRHVYRNTPAYQSQRTPALVGQTA